MTITDEMVQKAAQAMRNSDRDEVSWADLARAALEAAAPAIRKAALEEAAKVADVHWKDNHDKLTGTRKRRSDFDIGLFESAMSEAASIADAIRTLAGKEGNP